MAEGELHKQRDILFHALPPGQPERAARLLGGLPALHVESHPPRLLRVCYDLRQYTLAGLEEYLSRSGFHLDGSLLQKLLRALAHYSEEVQRENLAAQDADLKTREIYVRQYEHHLHGDRDSTPKEWRAYK